MHASAQSSRTPFEKTKPHDVTGIKLNQWKLQDHTASAKEELWFSQGRALHSFLNGLLAGSWKGRCMTNFNALGGKGGGGSGSRAAECAQEHLLTASTLARRSNFPLMARSFRCLARATGDGALLDLYKRPHNRFPRSRPRLSCDWTWAFVALKS